MNGSQNLDDSVNECTTIMDGFLMIAAIAGTPSYLTQTVYPDLLKARSVREVRVRLVKWLCEVQKNAGVAKSDLRKAEWHLYSTAFKATIRLIDYISTTGEAPQIADSIIEAMGEMVLLDARASTIERLMESWRVNNGA